MYISSVLLLLGVVVVVEALLRTNNLRARLFNPEYSQTEELSYEHEETLKEGMVVDVTG
jgi:hypothetical protein